MAKYAVAESQTCTSRIPRRTSDHLNESASLVKDLLILGKIHPNFMANSPI